MPRGRGPVWHDERVEMHEEAQSGSEGKKIDNGARQVHRPIVDERKIGWFVVPVKTARYSYERFLNAYC